MEHAYEREAGRQATTTAAAATKSVSKQQMGFILNI